MDNFKQKILDLSAEKTIVKKFIKDHPGDFYDILNSADNKRKKIEILTHYFDDEDKELIRNFNKFVYEKDKCKINIKY